jgi:hypothetical protein
MAQRGRSLVHCLIFKSARMGTRGRGCDPFGRLRLSAGFNFPIERIVMPLLLQNRSKPGVPDRTTTWARNASGIRRVGGEKSTRKGISAIFLHPCPGVLLLAVTVAAVIARAHKRAVLSTAVRARRLFFHRYAMMMEPPEAREKCTYGICS